MTSKNQEVRGLGCSTQPGDPYQEENPRPSDDTTDGMNETNQHEPRAQVVKPMIEQDKEP